MLLYSTVQYEYFPYCTADSDCIFIMRRSKKCDVCDSVCVYKLIVVSDATRIYQSVIGQSLVCAVGTFCNVSVQKN